MVNSALTLQVLALVIVLGTTCLGATRSSFWGRLMNDETGDYEYYGEDYYEVLAQQKQGTDLEEFSWSETSLGDYAIMRDSCYSDPCKNGGTCEPKGSNFTCRCPKPYGGTTCETVEDMCLEKNCHFGDCLITLTPPYYECSCKPPYRKPFCQRASQQCSPNPCQNGGTCIRNRYRSKFTCNCPEPFRGRFCEIGPDDCYEEDSSTYRGRVNQAENGRTCLHWNSHHLLDQPFNAFMEDADSNGLGEHNFCRNPDDDEKPWCYVKKNKEVDWEYCDVSHCSDQEIPTEPPTDPPETFQTCGQPEVRRTLKKIYGGSKATPGKHPWMAYVQIHTTDGRAYFCGGVLIRSCWVLTAAHCLEKPVKKIQVSLGKQNLQKKEDHEQIFDAVEFILHSEYKDEGHALHSDIALLKLRAVGGHCALETKYVKTACLPDFFLPAGTSCLISGWGRTERGDPSDELLDANVRLISRQKCNEPKLHNNALDDSMFCAGRLRKHGIDSCTGDSGGPLACVTNGSYYVYGLVSWGKGCGLKNKPGVYTQVTKFTSWIRDIIKSSSRSRY